MSDQAPSLKDDELEFISSDNCYCYLCRKVTLVESYISKPSGKYQSQVMFDYCTDCKEKMNFEELHTCVGEYYPNINEIRCEYCDRDMTPSSWHE